MLNKPDLRKRIGGIFLFSLMLSACMVTSTQSAWTSASAGAPLDLAGIPLGIDKASLRQSLGDVPDQAWSCSDLRVAHAKLRKREFVNLCELLVDRYTFHSIVVSRVRFAFVDEQLVRMDIQAPQTDQASSTWADVLGQQQLNRREAQSESAELVVRLSGEQGTEWVLLSDVMPGFSALADALLIREAQAGAGSKLTSADAAKAREAVAIHATQAAQLRMTRINSTTATSIPALGKPEF